MKNIIKKLILITNFTFLFLFVFLLNPIEVKAEYWEGYHGSNYEVGGGNLDDFNNYSCPSCNHCGCGTHIHDSKAPSCTSSGFIAIRCDHYGSTGPCGTYCVQVGEHNFTSITHNGMDVRVSVSPTCRRGGTVSRYCSNCGAHHSDVSVGELGHSWYSEESTSGFSCSCGEGGLTTSPPTGQHYNSKCSRCSCKKDLDWNTYYVNYTNSAYEISNGATGSKTGTYKYNSSYNWADGSGFVRTWDIYYDGRTGGSVASGSNPSTKTMQNSYAYVVSWTYGGSIKPINSSGLKNLTATHYGSVSCTANYGTQTSLTFPGETGTASVQKVGYTLVGWTLNANSPIIEYPHDYGMTNAEWLNKSTTKSCVEFWPGETRIPDKKTQTYYAVWIPNEYYIAYQPNASKYDTNHTTTIQGKTFDEFYKSGTDKTSTTGSMTKTLTTFDGKYTLSPNKFTKTSTGFYGNTIKYTFVGWSLKPNFSSFSSTSRTTSTENNETTPIHYYGYVYKPNLLKLSTFNYKDSANTYNKEMLYFYNNETIQNYRLNGAKTQFNLNSEKNGTTNLYAEWIAENQRPFTYFRLATRQYYGDGRATGLIEDIMYDNYPNSTYTTKNNTLVYDDMPIYLDTLYYDPEGRVDDGQYVIEYQYSIDGGNTWYKLTSGLNTPNFYTTTTTFKKSDVDISTNLDTTDVIDNAKAKQLIYDDKSNSTTSATLGALEIHFYANTNNNNVKTDSSLTTLIRSRARDTVDYPTYITSATRLETDGSQTSLSASTKATLQKPLWSTGNYAFKYSDSNINGTLVDDYTGKANDWNGQKAFEQNTVTGENVSDNSGDNGGDWYTKTIICYPGNSTSDDDKLIAAFDNKYAYPMYDYNNDAGNYNNRNGNLFLLVSKLEENNTSKNEDTLLDEVLANRGYVTYDNYGNVVVDYRPLYSPKAILIRQTQVEQSKADNIHNKYSHYPNADETIGFINLSADLDNEKHYNNGKNPSYTIDNTYNRKYFQTGDTQNDTKLNKQFSSYFVAIYDVQGNEVLTQGGASKTNVTYTKDANGVYIPANGSQYTFLTSETGLPNNITGHIYNSYEQMISDIYKYSGSMFSEYSDMLNGEYTVYYAVCDKSWNLYSPNKWAMQVSTLVTSPRLSFYDIGVTNFRQTGYKNEDKVQTLWLRTGSDNQPIALSIAGVDYKFPMYKLSGLNATQTINGYKLYITNFTLSQDKQRWQLNTDYVKDTTLGYKVNPIYKVQGGYNFTINVDIQGADYTEIAIYSTKDTSKPVQVIQKDFNTVMNKEDSNVLYSYACRQNGFNSYTIAFPEQVVVGDKYYVELKAYKTTLTNSKHALSASNAGTTTLYRTFKLGSKDAPLIEIEKSILEDIGVDLLD